MLEDSSMKDQPLRIDLTALATVSPLSPSNPSVLASLAEAASVMLDAYHPAPPSQTPVELVRNGDPARGYITWHPPSPQARDTHANEKDATEDGACAIAIATVHELGYTVVRRTRQGSGCDYLMVRRGDTEENFHKLEVSGTGAGNLPARVKAKVDQGMRGDLEGPGAAVVVGFKAAKILVEEWT
jgi:hypothetical protein